MWDPQQYQRFEKERQAPFFDLLQLIKPAAHMRVLDLGSGDGKITALLHRSLKAQKTVGIDPSIEMLREAESISQPGVTFVHQSVEDFEPTEKYDLIFSNASLQWVPDHPQLFTKFSRWLTEEGQFAIQMPANFDYPTHVIARQLASEEPFCVPVESRPVLSPEAYAQLLYDLGCKQQQVRLQIYAHELRSTESLIDWVKGSLFSHYRKVLSSELYQQFLQKYRLRLIEHFGIRAPFFMPFKRLLIWAGF